MGNKRISELQIEVNPQISDLVALASDGTSKRTTLGSVVNAELPATFGETTINGDLNVNGDINVSTIVSASVLYKSGSTLHGNSADDIHIFTGSLSISGSTELGGDIYPQTPQGARLGTPEKPFREIYLQSGSISIESDTPDAPSALISNFNGNVDIRAAGFSISSGSLTPFRINDEGQIIVKNSFQDPTNQAVFRIIGNNEASESAAVNPGSLVHVTGFDGITNRSVFDSYGGSGVFSQLILRNAAGTAANPTSTTAGIIGRVATSGYISDIGFGVEGATAPPASMNFYTPGYSSGSRETMIRFYATANNELDPTNYSAVIKADGVEVTGSLDVSGSTNLVGNATLQNELIVNNHTQFNHGGFDSTVTQTATAGVSGSITFNNTNNLKNVSLVSNSKITVAKGGVYNIQFSAQIDADDGAGVIYIWFKKNGTSIPNSATKVELSNNDASVMTVNILDTANDNDYYELAYQNSDGNLKLKAVPAAGNIPSIPSVIATITQVG